MFTQEIKSIRSLDELKNLQQGDIIGMGQLIGETIPALCIEKDEDKLRCLGGMDGEVIVDYNFRINKVEGFKDDGSIAINYDEISEYFSNTSIGYEERKQILIDSGKWSEK